MAKSCSKTFQVTVEETFAYCQCLPAGQWYAGTSYVPLVDKIITNVELESPARLAVITPGCDLTLHVSVPAVTSDEYPCAVDPVRSRVWFPNEDYPSVDGIAVFDCNTNTWVGSVAKGPNDVFRRGVYIPSTDEFFWDLNGLNATAFVDAGTFAATYLSGVAPNPNPASTVFGMVYVPTQDKVYYVVNAPAGYPGQRVLVHVDPAARTQTSLLSVGVSATQSFTGYAWDSLRDQLWLMRYTSGANTEIMVYDFGSGTIVDTFTLIVGNIGSNLLYVPDADKFLFGLSGNPFRWVDPISHVVTSSAEQFDILFELGQQAAIRTSSGSVYCTGQNLLTGENCIAKIPANHLT